MLWVLRTLRCTPCVALALLPAYWHAHCYGAMPTPPEHRPASRVASAVLEIWGTGQTRYAQTAPGSDPKFLRSSSPALLLGGVGIALQQRALGVLDVDSCATVSVAAYAIFCCASAIFILETIMPRPNIDCRTV
jgi:hypothetical protein